MSHNDLVIWAAVWGRPTMHAYTANDWADAQTTTDLTSLCGRVPTKGVYTNTPDHITAKRCRSCELADIRYTPFID